MEKPEPRTTDELRELAADFESLAQSVAWREVERLAGEMFGSRVQLERIGAHVGQARVEEIGAQATAAIAVTRAVSQLLALPRTLADKYRKAAEKVEAAQRAEAGAAHPLGPDVELTR